jgi:hypothetical protein
MPRKPTRPTTKSEADAVGAFVRAMKHPLKPVVEELRAIILATDPVIGEEIKWNSPAFFYSGPMPAFDAREHRRHLAVVNVFKKDCVRVVFLSGARTGDTSGLLTGDYADGRRLALFSSVDEVRSQKTALERVIRKWLDTLEKD